VVYQDKPSPALKRQGARKELEEYYMKRKITIDLDAALGWIVKTLVVSFFAWTGAELYCSLFH
jgi:hypothetical protein